jgi:hypothetical protein
LVKTYFLTTTDRGLEGEKARQFALKRWKCIQNSCGINLKKALLYNGCRVSFPGVKRPGRGDDHPPPRSTGVKERRRIYVYSPSGPSWPVIRLTSYFLPLILREEKILRNLDVE